MAQEKNNSKRVMKSLKDLKELTLPSKKEIENEINSLTHLEMAKLWRFAPSGHKYFDKDLPYWPVFKERWEALGGMTPAISKSIGWK